MRRRKIASVDLDTGEVLDGVIVYCGVKHNPYSKGWVMNSQDALELLATDNDLKGFALHPTTKANGLCAKISVIFTSKVDITTMADH